MYEVIYYGKLFNYVNIWVIVQWKQFVLSKMCEIHFDTEILQCSLDKVLIIASDLNLW